jgi:hypothetical protein
MLFNSLTWHPIAIDSFGFLDAAGYPASIPSTYVRIYSPEGMIIAKRCPTKKALYCSKDGHFFSLTEGGSCLREVKPGYSKKYREGGYIVSATGNGGAYPVISNRGKTKACHSLMWETWVGKRTKGMQIDHLNGEKLDWSLENLEEVTPAENYKRAKLLRELRSIGRDPKQMSRTELQAIFRKYRFDKVRM